MKKVFLKISHYSQENTCARGVFNKLAGLRQRDSGKGGFFFCFFFVYFAKFLERLFYNTSLVGWVIKNFGMLNHRIRVKKQPPGGVLKKRCSENLQENTKAEVQFQ